ncbi:unnamed protein product [Closterium sp. NIES-53]
MAARIASKSRSKIATPALDSSPQRGISAASGNCWRQASVRRQKQRWAVGGDVARTLLLLALTAPSAAPLRSSTPTTSTSATPAYASTAATSATATATATAAATPASTAATSTSTPATTSTATPTPSAASTSRGRRRTDRLKTTEVGRSGRGDRGQERGRRTPLKDGGAGVTSRGSYSNYALLCCEEGRLYAVDCEGGRTDREEVVPDYTKRVREASD